MNLTRIATALMLSISTCGIHAATYEIVTLPTDDLGTNSFAQSIDDSGLTVSVVDSFHNPPIDLTLLNFNDAAFAASFSDLEGAKIGDFNVADLNFISSSLRNVTTSGNRTQQQLAVIASYSAIDNIASYIKGFDVEKDETNGFTFSMRTFARDSVNGDTFVGYSEGLPLPLQYTTSNNLDVTFFIADFNRRGFVQIGDKVVDLPPVDTTVGGNSEAFKINNNLEVVGFGTTDVSTGFSDGVTRCNDDDARGDIPLELCLSALADTFTTTLAGSQRAMKWTLSADGSVAAMTEYDLVFTPEADDQRVYNSRALSINDNGIIVGDSNALTRRNRIYSVATMFSDSGTNKLNIGDEELNSSAIDINNNNIATGFATKTINGVQRTKFFTYDIAQQEVTFPDDFFKGSASIPRAINDNNIVVGQGQVEATLELPNQPSRRRRHGFIYDMNNDTFTNLNDTLGCNSPYTIVDAVDINNDNRIIADALVKQPALNVKGEKIFNAEGEELVVDTVVSVVLQPLSGGQLENCEDEEAAPDRQGASTGLYSLFFGLCLLVWRRKTK